MKDNARVRELLQEHSPRLSIYLRALLPNGSDDGFLKVAARIQERASQASEKSFAVWSEGIARSVASELRQAQKPPAFSDDLFRQLADSVGAWLTRESARSERLKEILARLPTYERELLRRKYELDLTAEQIALTEDRPAGVVSRDLNVLHSTLVSALREAAPNAGPPPPGGAADLGRMTDHLLDGALSEDGRLVLETLLLADPAAQAHYVRHVALAVELKSKYPGETKIVPAERSAGITKREWFVTVGFVIACILAVSLIAFVLGSRFNWW